MTVETLKLFPNDENATLTSYITIQHPELTQPPRPAMLICPGGGYGFVSEREAEPIAIAFLNAGYNCFILRYSVNEKAKDYAPLIEASLSMKNIRENAEKYNIDPCRVFAVGFSAGAHLVGSLATLWDIPEVSAALGNAEHGINKPTGAILSYPVISALEFTHKDSFCRLCGKEDPSKEELEKFSLEHHVKNGVTSPCFIWHTFPDATVPVQNSIMFANTLANEKVPFELHIFPNGPHGLSLANKLTATWDGSIVQEVQCWIDLAVTWAENIK